MPLARLAVRVPRVGRDCRQRVRCLRPGRAQAATGSSAGASPGGSGSRSASRTTGPTPTPGLAPTPRNGPVGSAIRGWRRRDHPGDAIQRLLRPRSVGPQHHPVATPDVQSEQREPSSARARRAREQLLLALSKTDDLIGGVGNAQGALISHWNTTTVPVSR